MNAGKYSILRRAAAAGFVLCGEKVCCLVNRQSGLLNHVVGQRSTGVKKCTNQTATTKSKYRQAPRSKR
jgi:hypothetical protein